MKSRLLMLLGTVHVYSTAQKKANNNNDNNKFVEHHFPMVQWRFTALTKKLKKNLNIVKQVSNLHKNKEKGVI